MLASVTAPRAAASCVLPRRFVEEKPAVRSGVPVRRCRMRAAFYERNGSAREVLRVGDIETPHPGAGEVRVKLAVSGVNPSDVKSRLGATRKIAWPRVIPQSDGAGVIDEIGDGVPQSRLGERVWTWNGQWKRPFGT